MDASDFEVPLKSDVTFDVHSVLPCKYLWFYHAKIIELLDPPLLQL